MLAPLPETTALLDANVLYPAPLRDLLMHLAVAHAFRARWSEQIHDEWIRNLLKNRIDIAATSLAATRAMMNSALPDAMVRGHEPLIPTLILPDEDDRHVLAAAIWGDADVIVTFNLKDFPAQTLDSYGLIAQPPDAFICGLMDIDADRVCLAVSRQRALLR